MSRRSAVGVPGGVLALGLWLAGAAQAQPEGPPAGPGSASPGSASPAPAPACAPGAPRVAAPAYAPSLHCDAQGCCTLRRAELQALVLDPTPLLRELRLVPTDGKPKTENNPRAAGLGPTEPGFRVFGLREGTLFHRLGVRKGDVLVRLNGIALRDPVSTLGAVSGLGAAREIRLTVERFGAPAPLQFVLIPTEP